MRVGVRGERQKNKFIKRVLVYAGATGTLDATISRAVASIRQKKRRSLVKLLRASSGDG